MAKIATITVKGKNGENSFPVYSMEILNKFTQAFDRIGTKYEISYSDKPVSEFLLKSLEAVTLTNKELFEKAMSIHVEGAENQAIFDEVLARFGEKSNWFEEWAEIIEA